MRRCLLGALLCGRAKKAMLTSKLLHAWHCRACRSGAKVPPLLQPQR